MDNFRQSLILIFYSFSQGNNMDPVHACYNSGQGAALEHQMKVTPRPFSLTFQSVTYFKSFFAIFNLTPIFSLSFSLSHTQLTQDALSPPLQFVPWILINGVHTDEIQNDCEVCDDGL